MRELASVNKFTFEGRVDVMLGTSTSVETLTVLARNAPEAAGPDGESLKVGEVHELLAEGRVRIEQEGQLVNAETVVSSCSKSVPT